MRDDVLAGLCLTGLMVAALAAFFGPIVVLEYVICGGWAR